MADVSLFSKTNTAALTSFYKHIKNFHFTTLMFRILVNTRKLHGWKTEHFKALSTHDHSSVNADNVKTTDHNIKWDYFGIGQD